MTTLAARSSPHHRVLVAGVCGLVLTVGLARFAYDATFIGIVGQVLALVGRHHPENPSAAMARLTLGYGAAQMLAPALAGTIAETTGSYRGALYLAAGVMAAGMAPLVLLQRRAGAPLPSAAPGASRARVPPRSTPTRDSRP